MSIDMFPDSAVDYLITNSPGGDMIDQNKPEVEADEDDVTVGFTFHNPTGEGDTIVSMPLLGTDLYVLIQPGENGPEVESSHATPDEVAGVLTVALAGLLLADEVSDEAREGVYDLIEAYR